MKIISVRFLNLNSLQGEHLIRFDEPPLSESGLFAITGPTGAGKTTILDAITVALYGEVPRHTSGKPIREIMTRHTGEAKSEVEFIAHHQLYRSTWSLRRSRGKASGEFQSVHMELCLVADDKPFDLKPSEVPKKVAEIVGLDFQQFLRSVMLSQGDFTRFLKASESERSELLEKLTDTRIYSQISIAAFHKSRTEKEKLLDLERLLQTDQLLPEETRQAIEQEIEDLKTALGATQQKLKQLLEQQAWFESLAKLKRKEAEIASAVALTQEQSKAWEPHRQKLINHEQALPFQSDVILLTESKRQHLAFTQALESLRKQIPEQEQKVLVLSEQAQKAKDAHQLAIQSLTEAEPKLDQVLQKDSRLKEQQIQLQKENATLAQSKALVQKLSTEVITLEKGRQLVAEQEQDLCQWLLQHQQDAELTDSIPELRAEAKSLREIRTQQEKLEKEKAVFALDLKKEAENSKARQAQLTTLTKQLQEKQAALKALKDNTEKTLNGQNSDALENLCHQLPQVCSHLEKQLDLSKNYLQLETRRQALQAQMSQTGQQLHQLRTVVAQTKINREQAQDKLKDLQQIVDLQRQIQQYEEARGQLQPQQPCPLCGSVHHPYVEEHQPQSLSEAQQNLHAQQQRLEKLLVQEREEAATIHKLELAQQHQQEQVTHLAEQAQQLQTVFADLNQALEVTHALEDGTTINTLWSTRKKEWETATQTLASLRTLRRETEIAHQAENKLQAEQQQVRHEIEKSAQTSHHLDAQIQKVQETLEDLREQEQAVSQTVSSFFGSYGLSYSGTNGADLLAQLESRRQTYEQKKDALPLVKEKHQKARLDLENSQKLLQEKQLELTTGLDQLAYAQSNLQELQRQRNLLLPEGVDPQAEKKRLQEAIQLAAQHLLTNERSLQKETEYLNLLAHQVSAKQLELQATQERILELEKQLLDRISPLNLHSVEQLQAWLLPDQEARALRTEQENLQKTLNELTHSLQQTKTELQAEQAKKLTDLLPEELQPLIQDQEEEKNQHVSQMARLEMQLQQDAQLRAKHQVLTQQLEIQKAEAERWDRLTRLIGSADGKKFSKYAQSLTLARLVELGNRHLLRLNDRYRILKSAENELELQILDTYQGDAVRSVNSLSGGESFLVSLALALGLSDLASHKAQIHSLFIDEGFGTLDADTLDIAMDALESLQASGKMIGIISHVEALKERISTQVIVEKHAGGRSGIKVVSGLAL